MATEEEKTFLSLIKDNSGMKIPSAVIKASVKSIRQQVQEFRDWAKSFEFTPSWFLSPKTTSKFIFAASMTQGITTFSGWIAKSGLPLFPKLLLKAALPAFDVYAAAAQKEISQAMREHKIPFLAKDHWLNRIYTSQTAEYIKSPIYNWLLSFVARPGAEQLAKAWGGLEHDANLSSFLQQQSIQGMRDIAAYVPFEKALSNLRYKDRMGEAAQRYTLALGNLAFTAYLFMRAHNLNFDVPLPLFLGGAAPLALFLPWVLQLETAVLEKIIPSKNNRIIAIHPDLIDRQKEINQYHFIHHGMKTDELTLAKLMELRTLNNEKSKQSLSGIQIQRHEQLQELFKTSHLSNAALNRLTEAVIATDSGDEEGKSSLHSETDPLSPSQIQVLVKNLELKPLNDGYRSFKKVKNGNSPSNSKRVIAQAEVTGCVAVPVLGESVASMPQKSNIGTAR